MLEEREADLLPEALGALVLPAVILCVTAVSLEAQNRGKKEV